LRTIPRAHQSSKRTCRGATILATLFFAFWASFACDAQPTAGAFRIGYVTPVAQNMAIEYRSADGNFERLPALVAELVGLKVDVIAVRAKTAKALGIRIPPPLMLRATEVVE
jgi:hypothetical protein